jgi:phage-related baseplate assembly protein
MTAKTPSAPATTDMDALVADLYARLLDLDGVREAYDRRGQAMEHLVTLVNASESEIARLRAAVAAAEQRVAVAWDEGYDACIYDREMGEPNETENPYDRGDVPDGGVS